MTSCPTCSNESNPANFGGQCNACDTERRARLTRSARVLADHGQSDSEFGRTLASLGYR